MSTNLELLSENLLNGSERAYSMYSGFFKHYKIDGDTWKINITFSNYYNGEDIEVRMFTQEHGWLYLANFHDIAGMQSIPNYIRGEQVLNMLKDNIKLIECWLNTFH